MMFQTALALLLSQLAIGSQAQEAAYDASPLGPVCAKFETITVSGRSEFVDTDNSNPPGAPFPLNGQTTGDMTISVALNAVNVPDQEIFRDISLEMSGVCVITKDQDTPPPSAPTCFYEAEMKFCRSWVMPPPLPPFPNRQLLRKTQQQGPEPEGTCTGSVPECFDQDFERCQRLIEVENKDCVWEPRNTITVTAELVAFNPELQTICPELGCEVPICRETRVGGFTAHGSGPDPIEITGGTGGLFGAFGQMDSLDSIVIDAPSFDPATGDVDISIGFDIEICYYKRELLF